MQMKVTSKWWTSRVRGLFPGKTTPKNGNHDADEIALSNSGPRIMDREIREVRGPVDPGRSNDGKAVMVLLGSEFPAVSSRAGVQDGGIERQGLFLETTFSETGVKRGGHVRHRQRSTSSVTPAKSIRGRNLPNVPKATPPHSSASTNPMFRFSEKDSSSTTADTNPDPKGEADTKHRCTPTSRTPRHYGEAERNELLTGDTAVTHIPRGCQPLLTSDTTPNRTAKENVLTQDAGKGFPAEGITGNVHSRNNGHAPSERPIKHGEVKSLRRQAPDTDVADRNQPTMTTRFEVSDHFANDYVVASNLSRANVFAVPVKDREQAAKHPIVNADGISGSLINKDPVSTPKQVTEDARETLKHHVNDFVRISNGVTKTYEKVATDRTKDLARTSNCTTTGFEKIPNDQKTDLQETSSCTVRDVGKAQNDVTKDPERTFDCTAKDPGMIPNDPTKNLARLPECPTKELGRIPNDATKDLARLPDYPTKDLARPSDYPTKDLSRPSDYPTKDLSRPSDYATKDLARPSDYATKDLARPSDYPTQEFAKPSDYPTKDLARPSEHPTKKLESIPDDPTEDLARPSDSPTKDLPRPSENLTKDLGIHPNDPAKDLTRLLDCTTKELVMSPKRLPKDSAQNPKHSTARPSKHSAKDAANSSKYKYSTTPRHSSKDKEVRRLARNVVGSMETLMGELHGIVGDLRQLVQQIDTVTETIDHTCRHKDVRPSDDSSGSPTKRYQQKRSGEAPASVSSRHARRDVSIKGTASLGRKQADSFDNYDQAAWSASLHRLSYPQCSRWSPVPEGGPPDTDKRKQRHSKSSKRTRDSRLASQKKSGNTEEYKKCLPHSTESDYLSESPKDSDSVFTGVTERHKLNSPCNGASATQGIGASSDMSKYLPGSPSSFTTGEFDPTFINVISPDSEADWIKGSEADKGLENRIPFSAYEDKTAKTKDSDSVSGSGVYAGHVRTPPTNGLDSLMPDTSLKYWKEKMEWHCGSAESLTPQIDWSYLALTDHHLPGTALAGSFNPHHTDRMEPDSLLLHHHTMWSFASPQTSLPSNPHNAVDASPVPPPSETSNQPSAHNPSPEQPKSKPFLYTYNPNPEQPRKDPSKLALTGLRIKHEISDFSDKPKENNHEDQSSAVLSQGGKPTSLLTLSDAPRSVVSDQASLRWKCSGPFAHSQSRKACGSPGESLLVEKPSVDGGNSNASSTAVFPVKTEPLNEGSAKKSSTGKLGFDSICITRHTSFFAKGEKHRHGGGVYRSNAGVFSYVGRQCFNGFRLDTNSSGGFMKDRPPLLSWDVPGNGAAAGAPPQAEKRSIPANIAVDRKGEEVFAQPEQPLPVGNAPAAGNVPVDRSGNGMCALGAVKPQSASESGTHPATGVFPHVKQSVGGAPLGWNTSNKALPDWPSGDLSSIDASDTDVDDLSSPFLPLHFQYPRRSSAVDTSPERNSKQKNPRRSRVGSSTSETCSQDDSPPLPRHSRLRSAPKRVGGGKVSRAVSSPSGVCSSEESSLQDQDLQLSCDSSSAQKSNIQKRKFKHCSSAVAASATGTNPEQTSEETQSAELVAGDTMSSGGFEVGQSVDVTPESDLVGPTDSHYECDMESRLEQLSSEADESDFSDAVADAGSDVLEQSLASLEISGSAIYDRDVSTWKSYTMTHIDSDDVVSECTSDILNENFIEPATANPGFDDVNLNFDDINFPSMAY